MDERYGKSDAISKAQEILKLLKLYPDSIIKMNCYNQAEIDEFRDVFQEMDVPMDKVVFTRIF